MLLRRMLSNKKKIAQLDATLLAYYVNKNDDIIQLIYLSTFLILRGGYYMGDATSKEQ